MDSNLATGIGTAVRAARQKLGLTQAEVAEEVAIAVEVYGRIERGRMLPSVPTLARICRTLRLSADEAMGLRREIGPLTVAEPGPTLRATQTRKLLRRAERLPAKHVRLLERLADALAPPRRR